MKKIYYNAQVYTGSDEMASAFVVDDGIFSFVGDDAEAKAMFEAGDEMVDLCGHFVSPGFNDSHMHLLSFGSALSSPQLNKHTESLADMIQCMKDFVTENGHDAGKWLMGRGWNQDYFQDVDRMPNRYDLDKVSTEFPVVAVRACGHCLVVNSKALEVLGIGGSVKQIPGGTVGMNDGEPDGRFFDNAMDMVYDHMPAPDKDDVKKMIRNSCKALNSYGVTSSQTDDYCVFNNLPWATINEAYKELEAEGELTVRVYEQSNFTNVKEFSEFVAAGNTTGVGSDMFKMGPLKMLGDGALGARTAYLSRPYADAPDTVGLPVFTQEQLNEMVEYANNHDMQVAVHAIGDGCLDFVLNAIDRALQIKPREDHRHGVVHCQISRPDQLERMGKLGVHIYAQSIFLDYDNHIVETRVGKELASTSYNWKTLMNMGLSVSNGTDCPVELPFALGGIQCAVTRTSLKDHCGPYLPDQAFTVREALDSYTIESAKASFEEDRKGLIKAGYMADYVVLEKSVFEVDPETIKDIRVLETVVGGKSVYTA